MKNYKVLEFENIKNEIAKKKLNESNDKGEWKSFK